MSTARLPFAASKGYPGTQFCVEIREENAPRHLLPFTLLSPDLVEIGLLPACNYFREWDPENSGKNMAFSDAYSILENELTCLPDSEASNMQPTVFADRFLWTNSRLVLQGMGMILVLLVLVLN